MAKKNTATCTKMSLPKRHLYEISFKNGEQIEKIEIHATHISQEGDDLVIYDHYGYTEEVEVGGIRDWKYFIRIADSEKFSE